MKEDLLSTTWSLAFHRSREHDLVLEAVEDERVAYFLRSEQALLLPYVAHQTDQAIELAVANTWPC